MIIETCLFCHKLKTKYAYIMAIIPKPLCDEHYEKHYIHGEILNGMSHFSIKLK